MMDLNEKINTHFPGVVVRKDLVKIVKGNAIVPTYVLEYLLGQYCATNNETQIDTGIVTVKSILEKHYVHRNQANLIKSNIREMGNYKIIDKVSVSLNDKNDTYEASFSNLGIRNVIVDTNTIKSHPKLLITGVWCIAEIQYEPSEDQRVIPWVLSSIQPIQLSHFDFDGYLSARRNFSTDEWIDLLVQSMGFNPEMFHKRHKMLQLLRLVPFVERNYNLIELGPKGTGKSHIFSEFSPHGMLVSGGEVTVPKLFVNNSSGKLGLVGYWDVVAFDEFAGKQKKIDKSLVDILKNYLANKTFSRGVETLGAEASMAFIGNTKHNVPHMLKYSDLFEELPDKYYDSAFIDRLHAFLPGWEVDIIRGEMFSEGYGFVVDYVAEIFRHLRNQDFSDRYNQTFKLSQDIATRDKDAINKTFSGFMKLIFPNGEHTKEETEDILKFSIELRKRVKDQLMRLDTTFEKVDFSYYNSTGESIAVKTLEEIEFPTHYYKSTNIARSEDKELSKEATEPIKSETSDISKVNTDLKSGHVVISENQKGVSFDKYFGPYLVGAKKITLTDPYIRIFHQMRNLMELIETVRKFKKDEDIVEFSLLTQKDEERYYDQEDYLTKIQMNAENHDINLTWKFDLDGTTHARHIVTDTGWKISLDRGLDVFQRFEPNDAFNMNNRVQETRACKSFEITYLKV